MRIHKLLLILLGILLAVFGGGAFFCCAVSAIIDGFWPIHVVIFLLFSFGVILAGGIVMLYLGLKKNLKSKEAVSSYDSIQIPDQKTVKNLLQELRARTRHDSIIIQIDERRKPTLCESKIGGIPYWDKRKEYPTASDGSKLMLLAQFNLKELPKNQMLPETGILQFFIMGDRAYGMSIQKNGYPDNTYQVIYHEKVNESITEADVLAIGIRTSRDLEKKTDENEKKQDNINFPVRGEYAVYFKMKKAYMNDCDVRCNTLLHKIAEDLCIDIDSKLKFDQLFDEYDKRYADIHEATYGHRLFGYPSFRKSDPRNLKLAKYYDTLLFQLDSQSWYGKNRVLWGNSGVGNFFINGEKLAKMDFTDVLYYWDCF